MIYDIKVQDFVPLRHVDLWPQYVIPEKRKRLSINALIEKLSMVLPMAGTGRARPGAGRRARHQAPLGNQ
jgi:hypothetical protein